MSEEEPWRVCSKFLMQLLKRIYKWCVCMLCIYSSDSGLTNQVSVALALSVAFSRQKLMGRGAMGVGCTKNWG